MCIKMRILLFSYDSLLEFMENQWFKMFVAPGKLLFSEPRHKLVGPVIIQEC
jgi:hypothetical protein